jgi:MoxR-like ATPase
VVPPPPAPPPDEDEAENIPAGEPLLPLVVGLDADAPLRRLARMYALRDFDLNVLVIALAPELDLRYERLYAYLQDDVSRRRASVNLALDLLCADAEEKTARRAVFAPDAPLVAGGILHLIADRDDAPPPLLSHFIQVDSQVIRFLIGEVTLDPRLAAFSHLIRPAAIPAPPDPEPPDPDPALSNLLAGAWDHKRALRLYFQGEPGCGQQQTAERLTARLGIPLLLLDLTGALAADPAFTWVPQLMGHEVEFRNALIYLRGFDALRREDRAGPMSRLWGTLVASGGLVLIEGTQPWAPPGPEPAGVITIPFSVPDYARRRAEWEDLLRANGVALADDELDTLARRFRLSLAQIEDAAATAANQARWRATEQAGGQPDLATPDLDDLFAAARAQTGHELATMAQKITPLYRWDDIVLPEATLVQVREICRRAVHGEQVLQEWGFERKIALGKGTAVLFFGPSGTGKTMAAEIVAAEVGLDLYKIDLSSVVSKYIGETEKNLERIFRAAHNSNAILCFDEADALFGKRSEVRDSHDRYANIEISYLLQKMESYDGITILSTNLRQNLDDAFVRRMSDIVSFPFPDEASRRRIWEGIWPGDLPRAFTSADLDDLAFRFKLSGGNIKNVALAAAFMAAAENRPVSIAHLRRAVQREFQKMGKTLSQEELSGVRREKVA